MKTKYYNDIIKMNSNQFFYHFIKICKINITKIDDYIWGSIVMMEISV